MIFFSVGKGNKIFYLLFHLLRWSRSGICQRIFIRKFFQKKNPFSLLTPLNYFHNFQTENHLEHQFFCNKTLKDILSNLHCYCYVNILTTVKLNKLIFFSLKVFFSVVKVLNGVKLCNRPSYIHFMTIITNALLSLGYRRKLSV